MSPQAQGVQEPKVIDYTHSGSFTAKVKENRWLGIVREWDGPSKPTIVKPMGTVKAAQLREVVHGGYVSHWLNNPHLKYAITKDPMHYILAGNCMFTLDAKSGFYHRAKKNNNNIILNK